MSFTARFIPFPPLSELFMKGIPMVNTMAMMATTTRISMSVNPEATFRGREFRFRFDPAKDRSTLSRNDAVGQASSLSRTRQKVDEYSRPLAFLWRTK
jgi:hypothetical protein